MFTSIDLGSEYIKVLVMEYIDNKYNVLASTKVKSLGIKKGLIAEPDLVIKCLKEALTNIYREIELKVNKIILNIPSFDVETRIVNTEVELSGLVKGSDLTNLYKHAIRENVEENRHVLSVFPIDFIVDSEEKVIDPKGMNGSVLEGRLLISTIPEELYRMYEDLFNKLEIEIVDICISPIADYLELSRESFNKDYGAVVDIGTGKTEIGIFNKGLMIKSGILEYGSKKVDLEIRNTYNIDIKTAKEFKLDYGFAVKNYSDSDTFLTTNKNGEEVIVKQKELSGIIEDKLVDLLKNVKKYLLDLTNKKINYIIITGGISNIPMINILCEGIFGDLTYIKNEATLGCRDNGFTTCAGMVKNLNDKLLFLNTQYSMYDKNTCLSRNKNNVLSEFVVNKIQEYMNNN